MDGPWVWASKSGATLFLYLASDMNTLYEQLKVAASAVGSDSIAHKGNMWCTDIQAKDPGDAAAPFWIQLHAGMLNMQYLDAEDPTAVLANEVPAFPSDLALVSWEAETFCTFDVNSLPDEEICRLAGAVLVSYYGLGPNSEFSISTENLG